MTENIVKSDVQTGDDTPSVRKAGAFIQYLGLNMLMLGLLAFLAFLVWQRFVNKQYVSVFNSDPQTVEVEEIESVIQPAEEGAPIDLTAMAASSTSTEGIMRKIELNTIIPSRPRTDVITYTVQAGDTLFSIADNFSLKPETVLWGNFEVLNDNPHLLKPKQVLNILPINGTYYEWHDGDTLSSVASFFDVGAQDIINYPGNFLDLTQTTENGSAGIDPGTWIIVPGGKRAIKDWGPPAITRQNAASARYYGEGHCGSVYEGAYGTGTFVWPTTDHSISGYAYDGGVHPAIDIGGQEGNPVYASDSGVVVYAGWSDYGYGYLIVVDHGNGWQSAYAHLSAVAVGCGQSVYQSGYIGALGSTGNSSGPHLHFELVINGAKVNPLNYVQ